MTTRLPSSLCGSAPSSNERHHSTSAGMPRNGTNLSAAHGNGNGDGIRLLSAPDGDPAMTLPPLRHMESPLGSLHMLNPRQYPDQMSLTHLLTLGLQHSLATTTTPQTASPTEQSAALRGRALTTGAPPHPFEDEQERFGAWQYLDTDVADETPVSVVDPRRWTTTTTNRDGSTGRLAVDRQSSLRRRLVHVIDEALDELDVDTMDESMYMPS